MKEQDIGACKYLQATKSHLSDMVKGKVTIKGDDIVIITKELGEFHTSFDVWDKMICGIPSKDTAEVIFKQYRRHILNVLLKV